MRVHLKWHDWVMIGAMALMVLAMIGLIICL